MTQRWAWEPLISRGYRGQGMHDFTAVWCRTFPPCPRLRERPGLAGVAREPTSAEAALLPARGAHGILEGKAWRVVPSAGGTHALC